MKMRKSEEKKIIMDMLMDVSPETEELERKAFEFIEKRLMSRSAMIQRTRSDEEVILSAKTNDSEIPYCSISMLRCSSCDSPSGTTKKVMEFMKAREDERAPSSCTELNTGRRRSSMRSNSIVTEPERLLKCYLNVF